MSRENCLSFRIQKLLVTRLIRSLWTDAGDSRHDCHPKDGVLPIEHVLRNFFTARVRSTTGGYVFIGGSLLTGEEGGGTPSPSHNTSTGPMSFLGGYPSDWSQVPSQGQVGVPHK